MEVPCESTQDAPRRGRGAGLVGRSRPVVAGLHQRREHTRTRRGRVRRVDRRVRRLGCAAGGERVVNGWTVTATAALAAGGGATVWGVATGPLRRGVVAQNLSTSLACPALLLLAQGYDRPSYVDVALLLALL